MSKQNKIALVFAVLGTIFMPMMHFTYKTTEHPNITANPSIYRYTYKEYLNEYDHATRKTNFKILIGVFTTPRRIYNREAARQTWMKFVRNLDEQGIKVEIKFILGYKTSYLEEDLELLLNENVDDFIFLPVNDYYKNMANKILKFYQWASSPEAPSFDFLIKLDDDSFLNLPELANSLSFLPTVKLRYGFIWYDVPKESNNSKYYDDVWELGEYYPPYAGGPGHVVTYDLAKYIASIPNPLVLRNDDVNVDLWLYSVDVLRIHDERWQGGWALCCKETREEKLKFLLLVNVRPEEFSIVYNYMLDESAEQFPLKHLDYGDSKSCYKTFYPFRRGYVLITFVIIGLLKMYKVTCNCTRRTKKTKNVYL